MPAASQICCSFKLHDMIMCKPKVDIVVSLVLELFSEFCLPKEVSEFCLPKEVSEFCLPKEVSEFWPTMWHVFLQLKNVFELV